MIPAAVRPPEAGRRIQIRMFNVCFWFCTSWLLFTVVGNILGGSVAGLINVALLVVVAMGLVPYFWVRAGRLEFGACVWIGYAFLASTLGLAVLGTIRAPSLGFYLVLVICSGLVFGVRALVAVVVLCSAAVGGLIVAESAGWLPVPDYRVGVTQWVTATAFFACVGGLAYVATQEIRESLERAEHEVVERRKAEEALRESNRELQEALANVRTLKGLLPMCAWCHKVREDEGYWSALESYVAHHTDATFTHGICPECRDKHFPKRNCEKVPPAPP